MSDLKNRIKIIEKIAIPETRQEIIPILTKAWKVSNKTYYLDLNGQEHQFIQSKYKEIPIFNFVINKKEAGIPDN